MTDVNKFEEVVKQQLLELHWALGQSTADLSDNDIFLQTILAAHQAEVRAAQIDELEALNAANTNNGLWFSTEDKEDNNGWKLLPDYIKWRLAQLTGNTGELTEERA